MPKTTATKCQSKLSQSVAGKVTSPSNALVTEAVRFAETCGGSNLTAADYALTGLAIPQGWNAIDAQQARRVVDGFGEDEYRDVAESTVIDGSFSAHAFAVALENLPTPAHAAVAALLFTREIAESGRSGLVLEVAARVRARLAISMTDGGEATLTATVGDETVPYEFDGSAAAELAFEDMSAHFGRCGFASAGFTAGGVRFVGDNMSVTLMLGGGDTPTVH